jgi:hypothetical protein
MRTHHRACLLALASAASAVACSSSPSNVPSSNAPSGDAPSGDAAPLNSLSTAEKQSFCDSIAQAEGGYGTMHVCPIDGGAVTTIDAPGDQASCVADISQLSARPRCKETVGDFMGCVTDQIEGVCAGHALELPAVCAQIQEDCYGDQLAPPAH